MSFLGEQGETKEHVLEKHMFPPTERAFLPTDKLWVALDMQHLGHLTTQFVITALQVQIRSFRTQQTVEYFGAEI